MLWWLLLWIPLALGLPLFVVQVWRARNGSTMRVFGRGPTVDDDAELSRQVSDNLNV